MKPGAYDLRIGKGLTLVFAMSGERAEALIVDADVFFAPYRIRIVEFAAHHRLPAVYQERSYVDAGGLMSYGPNVSALGGSSLPTWTKSSKAPNPPTCRWSSP